MGNKNKTIMKIIYIYDSIARIGGTEKILVDKMNYLADNYNQEVYLITTSQGNHPMAFPLSKKVKHIDLSVRFHTKYQYSLLKRIYMGWNMNRLLKQKLKQKKYLCLRMLLQLQVRILKLPLSL